MGHRHSKRLENNLGSQFYESCSIGDIDRVRELLPLLSYEEVNYIDQTTGWTSLHAACANDHSEVVRLLLGNNLCNRHILTREKKIAFTLTNSPTIQSLFNRPINPNETNRFIQIREHQSPFRLVNSVNLYSSDRPDNYITGYFSSADARDAQLMLALSNASPIMRFLLYNRTGRESKRIVEQLIQMHIPLSSDQYERAQRLYHIEFLKQKSIKSLLTIFTLPTKFFEILHDNADAYTVILYLHLRELSLYRFRGHSYRGMMLTRDDLNAYRWAHDHAAIVETRTLQSTSKQRNIAEFFIGPSSQDGSILSTIVKYTFAEICPTAIDLSSDIAYFPEEEVLVLPFTLFRVTSIIEEYTENMLPKYEITMRNVPVTPASLWSSSRKRK